VYLLGRFVNITPGSACVFLVLIITVPVLSICSSIPCRNSVGITKGVVLSAGQLVSEVGVDGKSYKQDDGVQGWW
jgi:hypothetical protein